MFRRVPGRVPGDDPHAADADLVAVEQILMRKADLVRLARVVAVGAYDHVRDLTSGAVQASGIELIPQDLQIEEIFYRLATTHEWDVSEFSFGKYVSLRSRDDTRLTASWATSPM